MNLERVTIRPLVFPPKELLPPLPLYRNMTISSPPFKKNITKEMFPKYRGRHTLIVPNDTFVQLLVMFLRSTEYGAFQRTGGGEVYLVSSYRTLTVAYAVSGFLEYLPSPKHRGRAFSIGGFHVTQVSLIIMQ